MEHGENKLLVLEKCIQNSCKIIVNGLCGIVGIAKKIPTEN